MDTKKILGLLLIPLSLSIIAILAALNTATVYELPFLLPILNTFFLGIIPIVITYFAFRVFQRSGSVSVLLMGCGILIFGLGSISAGWLNVLPGGPNITVTIHNTCACIGSMFILAGGLLNRSETGAEITTGSARMAAATCAGIIVFVTLLSLAAVLGYLPPFFIPGTGPTVLRQIVLENAVLVFALSSLLLMFIYLKRRTEFFFWFSVSFALVSVGLLAVFFQPSVGSLIGWVGRSAQYLGFVFALYAVLIARRVAMVKGIPLDSVIANFFVDAEESYKQLVDTASDAIVTFDADYRILLWNTASETMFGYTRDEVVGLSFPALAIDERFIAVVKNECEGGPAGNEHAPQFEPVEIVGKRKDGTLFPVELTVSRRRQLGGLMYTCILRDLTERKRAEEALKKSTRLLMDTGEMAKVGGWELDLSTNVVSWTEEVGRIHGVEPGYKPNLEEAMNFYAPESRPALEVVLKKAAETGEPYDLESLFIPLGSKDKIWVRSLGKAVYSDDGKIVKLAGTFQNIDKYKRAEETLRESEERFRTILHSMQFGIVIIDAQTHTILDANEKALEMIGGGADVIAGSVCHRFICPAESGRCPVTDLKQTVDTSERVLLTLRGEKIPILKSVITTTLGGKKVLIESFIDITERKQAEEKLKESEGKYRTLVENIPEKIFVKDALLAYVSCNDSYARDLGIAAEAIAGKTDFDFYPRDLAEKYRADDRAVMESGATSTIDERYVLNGVEFWVSTVKTPIRDNAGNISGILGIFHDITEQKRAEEVIRESEERYRTLAEASPDQIFIVGRDDTMKYANTASLKLFRLPYDQVVGTPRKNLFPPDIADAQGILLKKVFETGERLQTEEKIQFGTQELWIDTYSVPLKDKRGNVTAVLGVARDITERKKAEVLLKRFNEELEQKVKARTEELDASLQEKIVLLREIHHRVKNNLQIIISLINLQMRQVDDEQLKQVMAETQNRVRAMSLVHEKLYQSESLSHIDLSDYTRFLATQLFSYYGVNSRKVALDIAIGKVMVDINTAIPLGLIINELVSNALKHAFPSDRKGTITISSRYDDTVLSLVVRDDGIGLPPDLDWKNPESLGLRLVNSLVDQISGTIELKKEKGTTFIISIHRENG